MYSEAWQSKYKASYISGWYFIFIAICNNHDTNDIDFEEKKDILPPEKETWKMQSSFIYGYLKLFATNGIQLESLI